MTIETPVRPEVEVKQKQALEVDPPRKWHIIHECNDKDGSHLCVITAMQEHFDVPLFKALIIGLNPRPQSIASYTEDIAKSKLEAAHQWMCRSHRHVLKAVPASK